MSFHRSESLVPRNRHTLVVGIVARISGCAKQKEISLDDQIDHAKDVVAELYDGPVEYEVYSTKAKGERLDRPELVEIEAALRSKRLDLLVTGDLGRLVRGAEANCYGNRKTLLRRPTFSMTVEFRSVLIVDGSNGTGR